MKEEAVLQTYNSQIEKYGLLTAEEENELAIRMNNGDTSARERLINSNLKIVLKILQQYRGMGVSVEDLIGAGNLGLVEGTDRYKAGSGAKFITFVSYYIKHEMKKLLSSQSGALSMNYGAYSRRKKVKDICRDKGENVSIDEVAEIYGTSKKSFIANAMSGNAKVSLNDNIDDSDKTYIDTIEDEKANVIDHIINSEQMKRLSIGMKRLNERERQIIGYRYGLDGTRMTLREIGNKLGITYERVRQIEEDALKTLRAEIEQ